MIGMTAFLYEVQAKPFLARGAPPAMPRHIGGNREKLGTVRAAQTHLRAVGVQHDLHAAHVRIEGRQEKMSLQASQKSGRLAIFVTRTKWVLPHCEQQIRRSNSGADEWHNHTSVV